MPNSTSPSSGLFVSALKAVEVRQQLVHALRSDLIGPNVDEPRDAAHLTETLPAPPSSWYLTGFLAPLVTHPEQQHLVAEDETADEGIDSGQDGAEDGEAEPPVARRPIFPSSIGMSVLVPADCQQLGLRVSFGLYEPKEVAPASSAESAGDVPVDKPPQDGPARVHWVRHPYERTERVELNHRDRFQIPLPDSGGVEVRVVVRPLPTTVRDLVPAGTRYVTLFLCNGRTPREKPYQDSGFVFQISMQVTCSVGFVPRRNPRGTRPDDELDEQIADLQYRDSYEFGVGHGIAVVGKVKTSGPAELPFCDTVCTTCVPSVEVEKVRPGPVPGANLSMDALGALPDGAALRQALGSLVTQYRDWISKQREVPLSEPLRQDTCKTLLDAATVACNRIAAGIELLATDPVAFAAFVLCNQAMSAQSKQRAKITQRSEAPPTWYPFQLAFLLMNVASQVDPFHPEREAVDLLFFPTGGGKTEAYLGLAAFTLCLRRLRNPNDTAAGVTVLMRYTLRLLTLDQLERAATLICALEQLRRKDPTRLGSRRFCVGLWVGKAATPNRFGTSKDYDETLAINRVREFNKDPVHSPSPIPLERCPWCGEAFSQNTFKLKPPEAPLQLRVMCSSPKCEFRWKSDFPEGIPVVAVDDEIYRELPGFLIATVDKFAALPWIGKTGLLLGCNVTHCNALGFYGPVGHPPDATRLATPLLPPDLIIQDELHLISGPLGTMVGLYEMAIDHLTTRRSSDKAIRPKIVASTATVRRAQPQIKALFGRDRVDIFPPPGPDRRDSFFSKTVSPREANARLYLGVAAPGRSQKVLLMRTYMALLTAGQTAYEQSPEAADPYMTLVGYFNSLRELGGSRRIVEDEVRSRAMRIGTRRRVHEAVTLFRERTIDFECVELTSRESTDKVKRAKARLDLPFAQGTKNLLPVDVALASNMISVGLDILRLGLMVVCGQPKTTAEYIQATSRVGRDDKRPGLVVTLLNVHKPRDRSHYEHFENYHESFYRGVEATSVTPFSPRAVDRGLAAVVVALARLADPRLTKPDAAAEVARARQQLGFVGDVFARRLEAYRTGVPGDEPIVDIQARLRHRVESLLDSWQQVAANDPAHAGLAYQEFEDGQVSKRPLLRMPLDPGLKACDKHERRFQANRSLRDVEGVADVFIVGLKEAGLAKEEV